jgi:UPF0755 protein
MSEIIESNNIIRKKPVNVKAIIAISVAFIVLIGGILFWNHNHPDLDFPVGTAGPEIEVNIPAGSSGVEIGRILAKEGVVKTSVIFFRAATADKRAESISAGLYLVNTHLSAKEAIEQLLDKKRLQGKFLIIEGARLNEIKANLVKIGFTAEQVDKALNSIEMPTGFDTDNLEGLLFPANYTILPDEEVSTLLQGALDRFAQELKNIEFYDYAKELDLEPAELLTIASIVQAEGFTDEDFGKVSRVIYNRLKIGMPLQMDSTLLYANKSRGEIRVTNRELKIASKYNTYKYRGLPPGPISNPGEQAMSAAVNPANGDWLYYVTVKPGDTRFTRSFDEFNVWANEFRKNEDAGLFD